MRSPVLITLGLLLVGCGIDRGGAPVPSVTPVGQDRSIDTLIAGPIGATSTDSLAIDGINIGVGNAVIRVDGDLSALDLLQPGQFAVVRAGSTNEFGVRATEVDVDTEVIGPATAFDSVSNTLTILGQQVTISDDTVLDQLDAAAFNDVEALGPVRVSGIADGLGQIYATYIAPAPGASFRLTGFASQVDAGNSSFSIGPQSITYASAFVVELGSSALAENTRVALTGDEETAVFTVATIFDAPLIPDDLESDARIQLTAVITLPLTDGSFAAGFAPATLTDDATFADGDITDLAPGAIVTLQGIWNVAGHIDVTAVRVIREP